MRAPGLVLAIDTATARTAVAVVEPAGDAPAGGPTAAPRVLAEAADVAVNRHGEVLAPLVAACLRAAGATVGDLALVAAGTGPGPFTGLRVGLVTARALADALGVPVRGVCSLDAIADRHADGAPLLVVTDARRREVYWAAYGPDGRRAGGPEVERPAALAERWPAGAGERPLVVGAGLLAHAAAFDGYPTRVDDPYPDPVRLARLALDPAHAGPPRPLYLRRPDARPPGPRKLVTPA